MNANLWRDIIKNKNILNNIPVIGGCDFGHTTPTITFPIGGNAKIQAYKNKIELTISDAGTN